MLGKTSYLEAAGRVNSQGLTVTSGAANTKGGYVELIAATTYDTQGFIAYLIKHGNTDSDCLIDIAVGAAAAEQVIASNLIGPGRADELYLYDIPLQIPAGTRLSARVQQTTATLPVRIGLMLAARSNENYTGGSLTTYGADTTDSGAVSVDPGATANTKGAYSEITASTTYDHKGFILAIGSQHNFVRSQAGYRVDVAVGAAASEIVIVPDHLMIQTAGEDCFKPSTIYFPIPIPAGTRIAVRAQCSITDAADRLFDAAIYGVS